MNDNKLIQIEKLLTALLRNNNQLHWIGGYVHGRTGNDDPFIILYPASDLLNHKICRVYPHDFKKLPDFIDTNVPPGITQDGNPEKDKALKKGIYHPCNLFLITTYEGKETQMGPEVRFSDVIRIKSEGSGSAAQTNPTPNPTPAEPPPDPEDGFFGDSPADEPVEPAETKLQEFHTYARSKGLSPGAANLHLSQYGNPLDALQALQVEYKDRPEPPAHPIITMQQYWNFIYNTEPKWSREGGQGLLNKYHQNPTLAYQEAVQKKQAAASTTPAPAPAETPVSSPERKPEPAPPTRERRNQPAQKATPRHAMPPRKTN
jgi:hypothetical protein